MNYNRFDFIKHRKKFFTFSITLTLIGIVTLLLFGLNYGVDFKAGTTLDITVGKSIQKQEAEKLFQDAGLSVPIVTVGGDQQDRVSARFDTVLSQEQIQKAIEAYSAVYGKAISHEENTVDPELARELALKAIFAVLMASVGIIIYVGIRFEWRFAVASIVALLHDAFLVITIFSIFRLEVTLTFVAAVLTIVGYSINDTIVIFDRIRENFRFAKMKTADDLREVLHKSIWQTMTRSINTGVTVIVCAVFLLIFGSESLRLFSLAMLIGLIFGIYSSICIASPLYYLLRKGTIGKKPVAAAKTNP